MLADICCGIGYFTLLAVNSDAESGKVYTTYVSPEVFDGVQGKLKINKLMRNVQENCFVLKDESVSLAIHEAEDSFIFF